jgi:hypothetical protein
MTPARSVAAPMKSDSSTPWSGARVSTVTSRYETLIVRTAKPRITNVVPSHFRTFGSLWFELFRRDCSRLRGQWNRLLSGPYDAPPVLVVEEVA